MTRILIAAALLLVLLGLSACSSGGGGEMDERADIGTHSLYIRCTGKGNPVVVIDTGVGATQIDRTITGHSNQDLFWGVKAANAPNGAMWASRLFRIEADCSPSANQVSLYEGAGFGGQWLTHRQSPGWFDSGHPGIFPGHAARPC